MNRVFEFLAAVALRPFRPDRQTALRVVNRARMALGLHPVSDFPSGTKGSIGDCPLSQVLPGIVGANGVSFDQQEQALSVAAAWNTTVEIGGRGRMIAVFPKILANFVRDYDLGAYPTLVRKSTRRRTYRLDRAADVKPIQRAGTRTSDGRRAA